MSLFKKVGLLFGFIAASAVAAMPLGAAPSAAEFYSGRQVTLIVPTGPGGGYALYGQILKSSPGQAHPRQSYRHHSVYAGRWR